MENDPGNTAVTRPDLATVIGDVLGDLAFLVGDDESADTPTGVVWLEGEIHYRGPISAVLRCWCTHHFAVELTANLLGLEPDDEHAVDGAEDGLSEFLNVLCGQLITAWHGREPVFNLSIPAVKTCAETPNPRAADGEVCELSVSGQPFYCAYTRGDPSRTNAN